MYKFSELQQKYQEKLVTAEQAAASVKDGERISYGFAYSAPWAVDQALADRLKKGEVKGLEMVNCISTHSRYAVFDETDSVDQIRFASSHFSGVDRKMNRAGREWFIPMLFRECPSYWANIRPADVVIIQVAPMDKWGNFNVGPALTDLRGYLKGTKRVIVEVNENMPRALGSETELYLEDVDMIVEGDNPPMDVLPPAKAGEIDRKIGEYIAPLIEDGSTLQLGIGSVPTAIGDILVDSDVKNLHCHTEMMADPYVDLFEAGKLTGAEQFNKGKIVYAFAGGTQRLYDFLDDNQMCCAMPVSYVNDVHVISSIDKFISVNGAIGIDLYGQVCAESAGYRHVSGTGGQLDFVQGAYASKGGKSFIAMHATHKGKDGVERSTITPLLAEGSVVTTPRSAIHYFVTEYGCALLKGKTTWERSEAIINLAAPQFRDDLIQAAEKMGIWCNTSKVTY